ncbi:MAG: hypothetical protein ACKOFM_06925 [Actinomycetota bacterium]
MGEVALGGRLDQFFAFARDRARDAAGADAQRAQHADQRTDRALHVWSRGEQRTGDKHEGAGDDEQNRARRLVDAEHDAGEHENDDAQTDGRQHWEFDRIEQTLAHGKVET